jgi:hypothetical protein
MKPEKVAVGMVGIFAVGAWLLAFTLFIVPRAVVHGVGLVLSAAFGAFVIAIPFVAGLRGIRQEDRSERQWMVRIATPFLVAVLSTPLLLVSRTLAAIVFCLVIGGSLVYVWLIRERPA